MRQRAVTLCLIAALFVLTGCGGGFFFFCTGDCFTVSGTVTIVHLVVSGDGQVTVVTLVNTNSAQNFNFCGNVVGQFPSGAFVTVTFTQSSGCNNVSRVVQRTN